MTTLQERVVHTARGWLGTRFHHQGRLKKTDKHTGGVDCLGLLVGVAAELDLETVRGEPIAMFDKATYTHTPDILALKNTLAHILFAIPPGDMSVGDVVLMNIDGRAQHMGIITDIAGKKGIIHAYAPAHAVVEHILDSYWQERIVAVFRLPSYNN